jgi:aminoglycoside phosphotransferase (APT) family kinase protein
VDLDERVLAWLADRALPGRRIAGARRLTGGYSNDNVLIRTGTDERYVLRRYLRANTCAVEVALAARLTGVVPVAEVVAADALGSEAGEPVLLSRFVPGTLVGDQLPRLTAAEAGTLGHAAGAALAAIGTITFSRPGFFDSAELVPGPPGMQPTAGLSAFVDRCLRDGNANHALSAAELDGLRRLAERCEPRLASLRGSRQLVHADFNPKNLLAAHVDGHWRISAVLDWEFAFSSSPLVDIGNMLRHPRPAGYADGFIAGFRAHGGHLPADWPELSRALDLFSLADLLTRPPDHRYFRTAASAVRKLLAAG